MIARELMAIRWISLFLILLGLFEVGRAVLARSAGQHLELGMTPIEPFIVAIAIESARGALVKHMAAIDTLRAANERH